MPATSVTVRNNRAAHLMYWCPSLCPDKATKPPSHYAPAILASFERAVRASLRSSTDVLCDLSGGLDSSAVLGMAAKLRSEEPSHIVPIICPLVPVPGLGMRRVELHRGCAWPSGPCHGSDETRLDLIGSITSGSRYRDRLRWLIGVRTPAVREQMRWMRESGVRVELNGEGGDGLFYSAPLPLAPGLRPAGNWARYIWWSSRRSLTMSMTRVRRESAAAACPGPALRAYLRLVGFDADGDTILSDRALRMKEELRAEQARFAPRQTAAMAELWSPGALFAAGPG